MAKTIAVSEEVYKKLKKARVPGESFSATIKRSLERKPGLSSIVGSRTLSREDWSETKKILEKSESINGTTFGNALNEALRTRAQIMEYVKIESKMNANLKFVRSNWNKLKSNKGKAVVIAQGRLQGVHPTYEEARALAQKKKDVALVFVVDKPPMEYEIEFGAGLGNMAKNKNYLSPQ